MAAHVRIARDGVAASCLASQLTALKRGRGSKWRSLHRTHAGRDLLEQHRRVRGLANKRMVQQSGSVGTMTKVDDECSRQECVEVGAEERRARKRWCR